MIEKHPYTNRLIKEKSPYLQQHAHNPVDWYAWDEEAFKAAREQDKPIFLSIGYATCHWCHVMERESFENIEIAQWMNQTFINIKVDREELPHVDSLYMEFAQSMMAGAAGWPLNVILTPDLQPFFAATYLPSTSSHGMLGMSELIQRISAVWNSEEREQILAQASKIVEVFAENIHVQGDELPEKEQAEDSAELLFKMSDPAHGGMKGVPKFPIGYQSNFMMHYYSTKKDSRGLFIVERTLDMMQRGGDLRSFRAVDFPDIAWMKTGWFPILKKCYTTMPCSSQAISKSGRSQKNRSTNKFAKKSFLTSCEI